MYRRLSFLVLGTLALTMAVNAQSAISFGARTQIWPFMYPSSKGDVANLDVEEKIKLDVASGNLDRYAELGVKWNIVDVWQDIDGPDELRRLDHVLKEHERRGIQVALRLLERPEIYDEVKSGGERAVRALGEYREWVRNIAHRYGKRVRYYMISNEVDHDVGHNRPSYKKFRPVTVEEYGLVLQTAYKTIKDVDAGLTVADHGLSSYSLCLAVMADMARQGDIGEALSFWRSMDYESRGEGERSFPKLVKLLANSSSRQRIEFARLGTSEFVQFRDVYQMHHYFGAEVLPEILRWVRKKIDDNNNHQPILAAEVGYRIPIKKGAAWDGRPMNVADMSQYSEVEHGNSLIKVIATLAGSNVEDMLYWQLRFHNSRGATASLFPAAASREAFKFQYPARAFQAIVGQLTGAESLRVSPEIGIDGLVEYRFRGNGEFSYIWATHGTTTIPDSWRGRISRMHSAVGSPIEPSASHWEIDTTPVVVYWKHQ